MAIVDADENSKKVIINCHIKKLEESKELIIHGIQKNFRPCQCKLKIDLMIIGYDTLVPFFQTLVSN